MNKKQAYLILSKKKNLPTVIQTLLEAGADLNETQSSTYTAIQFAYHDLEIAKLLLAYDVRSPEHWPIQRTQKI